jgi:hypothetical protein
MVLVSNNTSAWAMDWVALLMSQIIEIGDTNRFSPSPPPKTDDYISGRFG